MDLEKADITMTNDLIRGKNNMDECEYKLFCAIVSQIDPFKDNNDQVVIKKKAFYDLLGLTSENKYNRWIKKAMAMMEKSKIMFKQDGKWQGGFVIQWVEDKGEEFVFTIAPQILPELEKLEDRQYARWLLRNTTSLESAYAMKLYAYLNSWKDKGTVDVEYDWLREFLMIGNKYQRKQNFETRCIDGPVKEINSKTNMFVEWRPIKSGNGKTAPTVGYAFKFETYGSIKSERSDIEWERIRDNDANEIDQFKLPF